MRIATTLLLPALLALSAAPKPAAAAVIDHLQVGLESGPTIPVDPYPYSYDWDTGTGYGVLALYSLHPRTTLVARCEQDHHDFNGTFYGTFGAGAIEGSDATFRGLWAGIRRQAATGRVRANATLYLGGAWREGRHAKLTTSGGTVETHGEPDEWVTGIGAGVGFIVVIPHFPDVVAEGRLLWLEPESQMPLRIGLVAP